MRKSAIATWGQRAYEEDIVQGRFFGRSSFILNTPDAIRHVLVDNYENYTRTPAGHPGAAPDARRGPADRRGPRLETSAPHAGAGLHAARGRDAGAAHDRGDRRDHREASTQASGGPVDLREAMQRMTLEIAGRTMFSFGMEPPRRGVARLRDGIWRRGWRGRIFSICCCRCAWPSPQDFARARFRKRWTRFVAMLMAERRAAGKNDRRAAARPVRPDGCRARSRDRRRPSPTSSSAIRSRP